MQQIILPASKPRRSRFRRYLAAIVLPLCTASVLNACALAIPLPVGDSAPDGATPATAAEGPVVLAGTLSYTNDLNGSYHDRAAVALVDLHGFVARDQSWRIPSDSLIFGRLRLDTEHQTGSYYLHLPSQPPGELQDVDHDGEQDQGVKMFAVTYWDDPFSSHDRYSRGWPTNLASTIADTESQNEITSGKLVVWAPDRAQQFPSGFGDDKRLFTGDDPLGPLEAGYSVIDLSAAPFAIDRSRRPSLKLYEESHYAVKDFSNLSYTHALQRLFEELRRDYAFNGMSGKQPDWDQLYSQLTPLVTEAEQNHDPEIFYRAMRDFVQSFHDGHVYLDGADRDDAAIAGGYGFRIGATDDERFLVVSVQAGGPAAQAGVLKGAELISFNGQPIAQALAAVQPPNGPFSTDLAMRSEQQRFLLRASIGAAAQIEFANPDQPAITRALAAVDQRDSSPQPESDATALPVEYRLLDSGLGYVRINSNADDFDLTDELFNRALDSFEYHEAAGIIVDLRQNDGGALLGFAGYLAEQPIALAQLQYFSQPAGAFVPDGPPETIEPIENPYRFAKIAVLVDQGCYSACELEAYGFSQLPGAIIVGQHPTAGVEAEVSQGQFKLPEDLWLQAPTGRYVLPDGQLFLEGRGVAPTLRVPSDTHTLLSEEDPVLAAAEEALLK